MMKLRGRKRVEVTGMKYVAGKLLLYIKNTHSIDTGNGMSVSSVKEEEIDCLEVLGR
jgi:hypothetical protein